MNSPGPDKRIIMLCLSIGSIAGGYLPSFVGVSPLSFLSIIFTAAGGLLGIWVGWKISS